jgi:hypothetical protein
LDFLVLPEADYWVGVFLFYYFSWDYRGGCIKGGLLGGSFLPKADSLVGCIIFSSLEISNNEKNKSKKVNIARILARIFHSILFGKISIKKFKLVLKE